MKIEFFGKDYSVSDSLKKMSEKKCKKLNKYFDQDAVLRFNVTLESGSYKTEIVVSSEGKQVRAEAVSSDPYSNLDVVIPRIEGQMRKKKSIWERFSKGRKNVSVEPQREVKPVVDEEPPKPEE